MPFEPGQSGNPAGRPKGAVNKTTKELREMLTNFLLDTFEEIQQCFKTMPPKEKVRTWTRLLALALPKLKPISDDELERLTEEQLDDLFERLRGVADAAVGNTTTGP